MESDGTAPDTGSVAPVAIAETKEEFQRRTLVLLAFDGLYCVLFFALFTELGYGASVFRYLSAHHAAAATPLRIAGLLILLIHILDARMWTGSKAFASHILFGLCALCLFIGGLYSFQLYPWLPLAFFLLFQPLAHLAIKERMYPLVSNENFMKSMALTTTVVGVSMALASLLFMVAGNDETRFFWGSASRQEFIRRLTTPADADGEVYEFGKCDAVSLAVWRDDELNNPDAHKDDCPCRSIAQTPNCGNADANEECFCLAAFLLWGSSAMASGALLVFAALFQLISRKTSDGGPIKVFAIAMVFVMITLWLLGTISGTTMNAAVIVQAIGAVFCVEAFIIANKVVGWEELKRQFMAVAVLKRAVTLGSSALADWLKAGFMVAGLPLFIIGMLVSVLNQAARKAKFGRPLQQGEQTLKVTKWYGERIHSMRTDWDWTSVLSKVMYLGVIYFIMSVGVAKISVVFLSWMNNQLEGVDLWIVCVAYILIGECMFLNPFCPATPVYLTGGVLVVRSAMFLWAPGDGGCLPGVDPKPTQILTQLRAGLTVQYRNQSIRADNCNQFTGDGYPLEYHNPSQSAAQANYLCLCPDLNDSFWSAVFFSAMVTFVLKMCAIFLEQVAIGMSLGKKLAVRKLVQVNSIEIKTIRVILDTKGLNRKKVAILLGGPDWPTSVLTGILRLSVVQMLIGSSPFLFLNTPTVMGGAFQLRRAESDMWNTMANVGFVMTAMTQGTAGAFCFYYIFQTLEEKREELEALPNDKEVEEADKKALLRAELFAKIVDWKTRLPTNMKYVLMLGAVFNGTWLFLAALRGSSCWETVDVAAPISGPPLCNNWFDWIKPWDAECHDVVVDYVVSTPASCAALEPMKCATVSGCHLSNGACEVQPNAKTSVAECMESGLIRPATYDQATDKLLQNATYAPGCTPVLCLRSTVVGKCCKEGGLSADFTRCEAIIPKADRPHGLGYFALSCFVLGLVCVVIFRQWSQAELEREIVKHGDDLKVHTDDKQEEGYTPPVISDVGDAPVRCAVNVRSS